jgi:hypothetical protein
MGANVSLSALYAWSREGERAVGSAPRNWGKNVTLLASITEEGVGPCLAVEGSTTREVFEAYLERGLGAFAAAWAAGGDGQPLKAHKGGRIKEIVEGRGCELLYLPPYSPDYNPHRAGVLEDQRVAAPSRGSHPQGADRGDGEGALCSVGRGRTGVLRPLWLP